MSVRRTIIAMVLGLFVGWVAMPVVEAYRLRLHDFIRVLKELETPAANEIFRWNAVTGRPEWAGAGGAWIDHGGLAGLGDDDHAQYLLLAGRSGGQIANGGTDAGDDLTLHSTAHATKGHIYLGATSAFDDNLDRLGLGIAAGIGARLHVYEAGATSLALLETDQVNGNAAVWLMNDAQDWLLEVDGGTADTFRIWDNVAATAPFALETGLVANLIYADNTGADAVIIKGLAATTPAGGNATDFDVAGQLYATEVNLEKVSLMHSANQNIASGAWAAVTFDTEEYDIGAMHDGVNPTRITFPVAGYYHCTCEVRWEFNVNNLRYIRLALNGAASVLSFQENDTDANVYPELQLNRQYYFDQGDYVECEAYQNTGAGLNILNAAENSPVFSCHRFG